MRRPRAGRCEPGTGTEEALAATGEPASCGERDADMLLRMAARTSSGGGEPRRASSSIVDIDEPMTTGAGGVVDIGEPMTTLGAEEVFFRTVCYRAQSIDVWRWRALYKGRGARARARTREDLRARS